jgi:pimeloyl-ACP methyl ester carboxylesterase
MTEPRLRHVQCLTARGLHRMAYWEWGDPANRACWCACTACRARGATSTRWQPTCASHYRVVCPDVVGRGQSDWLADPMGYSDPRLRGRHGHAAGAAGRRQVDWVGTSMGGLIGLGVAAAAGSPLRRLVLNDVGPAIEPASLQRIGTYLGQPARWATLDEAADALWAISQGFGPHTREQWLALTRPQLKADGDGFKPHYDPAIAVPFRAITPEMARPARRCCGRPGTR